MASQSPRPQAAGSFLKLCAAVLMSVAVAGCIPRTERPELPPPVDPVEEPEPVITPDPLDETPRHRVAVLVPLTGDNAGVGRSILNSANLALLDTGGERIRITAYDTALGAAEAANEALAAGEGLFLGPLLAGNVRDVAPIAARADVPVIAFSNDVSVAGDGVYVMGFNPALSVERVVAHARAQGAERFGALAPSGTYGQRAAEAMIEAVERAGGRMIGMQTYNRNASSLEAAADRLNGQGQFDAVLIADTAEIAARAVPALRQGSPDVRILGTELWSADSDIGSQAALRGAWFAAASDTFFDQFRTRYRARYGENPYRLGSFGYDAVLLAVRLAADWPLGRPFPEPALRDPTGFIGVDGAFRFRESGIADRMLEVRQVTAGGTEVVSPAPRGFD